MSWNSRAAKIRKMAIMRAATKVAKAAGDRSGGTDPRTGRAYGAKWKSKRRYASEVFDETLLPGLSKEERNAETVFEESPGLFTGLMDIDLVQDKNRKIAAFDMDYTLIKTKTESAEVEVLDWSVLNRRVPTKLRRLHADGYRIVIFTD